MSVDSCVVTIDTIQNMMGRAKIYIAEAKNPECKIPHVKLDLAKQELDRAGVLMQQLVEGDLEEMGPLEDMFRMFTAMQTKTMINRELPVGGDC